MSPLSYVRSIFALDTIDTRLTSSSSTPYKTVVDARSNVATSNSKRDDSIPGAGVRTDNSGRPIAQPSKWNTPEFYFYYIVFIITVPYMFWVAYDVSRRQYKKNPYTSKSDFNAASDPNYHKFESLLSPGWLFGRKIDITDNQYSTFRENLPYSILLLIFHPIARRLYNSLRPLPPRSNSPKPSKNPSYVSAAEGDARMNQRASFDFGFALLYLAALHGFSALKVLLILYINYCIGKQLPRKFVPAATWVFNISTLFANELSEGYRFSKIAAYVSPLDVAGLEPSAIHNWGTWLDSYGGLISRWEILFNLTVLRLISFNLDYYWSIERRSGSPIEVGCKDRSPPTPNLANTHKKKQLDPTNLSERERVKTPANVTDYSFRNYIAYAIYAPLYIAGPIITFNDYISQIKYSSATIEWSRTIKYGIRFLLCLLCMEFVLHFDYCVAISKANPNWSDYTPVQLSLLSYFNLHVLWLKLLLPWRLFRLWSLLDGIDPPENMVRCLSNNPSTVAFWRGWHRSYNLWLTRYLYIPLGGSSTRNLAARIRTVINFGVVFTFVALWHDISLNLLIWGWLIVLFMMPEVMAGYLFPRKKWENNLTAYRVLCGIGVVGNLMMMMMANLVGFAVGVDGLKSIIYGIFKDYSGLAFLVTASSVLFVGIQVMFEVRESERRQGIFLRY